MINIDRKDFYIYKDTPKGIERTKNRLTQLHELGMEEVGIAQFGIHGVISGIYIERVWRDSDKQWNEYFEWMQEVINRPR